jgi:hypothetical protein
MTIKDIISAIDSEIKSLQQARALLADIEWSQSSNPKAKRPMSPASRVKIAEAQRKRWAKAKKAVK